MAAPEDAPAPPDRTADGAAPGARPAAALPPSTAIGSVTLAVADLARSTDFYRAVLGFDVLDVSDGHAALGVDGRSLVRLERSDAPPRAPGAPGLYHLAVLLPDRDALAAWLRFALEVPMQLQGAADHAVSEAVYLADPEGNGIEVYRDRPRSAWRWDGEAVHMTTEPLDAAGLLAGAGAWRGAPLATRIGHVHLEVTDLQRSTTFFERGVGFTVTSVAYPGARFLAAGGYHHHVGLNTWGTRRHEPASSPPHDVLGLRAFELVLPDPVSIEHAGERLRAAGHPWRGGTTTTGTASPDGVAITFVEARADGAVPPA